MPWFFTIPEFLKKRACRYLLQHYLGQFLEERICLDDLTVDLYNGTGSIHNVPLNVEAINDVLVETGAPVKVISGYLGCVTVTVPWTALLKDNCKVEISELTLCVAPDLQHSTGDEAGSMSDSLFFSMTSSMQLAEEVLKSGPSPGEGEGTSSGFEGMEALARAIELVLARVQITLTDATVQVNYRTPDQTQEYFLKARINSIEFFDELSKTESSVDGESEPAAQPLPDFSVKVLQLSGLMLEVGSAQLEAVRLDQSIDESIDSTLLDPRLHGVPIATAGGRLSVRVKIKQNESEPGPKLEVEAFLGSLHLLLSPQQLSILIDMATGVASQGRNSPGTFEKLSAGQSRPIPKSDMKTIESQLAQHQLREQRVRAKLQQREDLFHADPWNHTLATPHSLTDSTHSTSDEFFSLDMRSSSAMIESVSLEDSYLSTDSKLSTATPPPGVRVRSGGVDTRGIPLHAGVGLQQLSQNTGPSRPDRGQRSSTKRQRADSGTSESTPRAANQSDVCKYSVTVGGITVALLETQPVYMYTTPGVSASLWATRPSSGEGSPVGETSRYSSVDEGGLDPMKYFESVCELLVDGVNREELRSKEEELAQVLPNDHLLFWLSTVKCSVMSSGPQVDLDLSVASAELWEYLYRNQARLNTITKPLSVSAILRLFEDSTLSPPLPCLKLKLSSVTPTSGKTKKKSHDHSSEQLTMVDVQLAAVHFNADVTLMDRLQPLISALSRTTHTPLKSTSLEKVKHSLYMTTSNYHTINQQRQAVFNHAVSAESTSRDHRLSIKVRIATLNLSLRFPIPDLKDTKKPPWYLPSLRSEVLFVSVSDVGASSQLSPSALTGGGLCCMDLKFESTKAYLSCDGSVEGRELFLTITPSCHQTPPSLSEGGHIRLVIQPVSDSALERGGRKDGVDILQRCDSFELGSEVTEPTPFSSRRTMFSTGKSSDKDGEGGRVHCEEQVLPGSPQEMEEFERHATDSAHYSLTFTLPQVKVHLPSNKFLAVLYNRFATDLSLWEPATPSAVERANAKSVMMSYMDVLQPAVTREDRFEMCKSVLKEEDSDDESNLGGTYTASTQDRTHRQSSVEKGLSSLAVSLSIEEGTMSMLTRGDKTHDEDSDPSSVENVDSAMFHSAQSVAQLLDLSPRQTTPPDHPLDECGLVLLQATGLHMFSVLGYKGDPAHDYFCVQISEFSLRHAGTLGMETYSCIDDPLNNHSILATLLPVVHRSSPPPASKPHPHTGYEQRDPMVAVAVEMKFDKERNSKTNKCSIALTDTTVQHHLTIPRHNCFKQLGDFLTLVTEEVEGYEAPSVITELHTHVTSCTLEYKPLHLPLHVLVCLDSVSLSTSLVTGAPVLVLRLVTDGTYLLLAHQQYDHPDPKQGFVCVLEMEWFELTLRLCNNDQLGDEYEKLFARLPDISVECSSNVVHLRTCADSCIALRDLLVYLATNGDLQTPNLMKESGLRDYTSLGREVSSLSSQNSVSSGGGSPLTSLTDTVDIGDLISDAMEDHTPPHSSHPHPTQSGRRKSGKKHKAKEAKMAIHVESDKSVVLDFCSDSSDDESGVAREGGVKSGAREGGGGVRSKGQLLSPSPIGKLSGSEHSSIFSESDDDFCFVDTPTSTRVSPGNKPQMKCLLDEGEAIELTENHFSLPDGHTDQLQRPKHFPEPVSQFTLKEMTIVWHLYGGTDFSPPAHSTPPLKHTPPAQRARSGSGTSNDWKKPSSPAFQRKYSSSPGSDFVKIPAMGGGARGMDWRTVGGPGRQHDVLVEVELDKLRIQHEKFPSDTEQSSRVVVLVNELEVRDRLRQSNINKLLYQYTTESMPRQSHAHMLSLKVLFTRPELLSDPSIEEASVRLSVLPIRLNIDQDTVLFLYEFMRQVSSTRAVHVLSSTDPSGGTVVPGSSPSTERRGSGGEIHVPDSASSPSSGSQEVFIRSFIFQPDLPIRIDYEAKGFKTEMGTLAGILLGLGHLNTSEVSLKALTNKKGVLGWDKLLEYASDEWAQDIKSYQLPLILKGVGPMHHVTQLVHGMVDLVWLPYQQYQEDGRIIWGLQRGATAFTSSTGVAIVELSSRVLESVQSFAQMAYDMVAPTECPSQALVHQHKPHQPLDFREGFANAYDVVSAGIGGTARDMYSAATREHEERGVSGAVGGVLRQIPGTIVKPIILASEATRHVLGGVKNQFVPDARKEASEKWKSSDANEQH